MKTTWRAVAGLGAEGPNGAVMPQRILEWMQDAAANASTLAGYSPDRYRSMGAGWFVKEIELAVDAPIKYRDEIEIETWVSEFRRFRSKREYRLLVNGQTVARARADWMLLERDASSGKARPLRPDDDMLAAFPVLHEHAIAEHEVPAWEEPSTPSAARDRRTVKPTELDRHAHVNHVVYATWLEDQVRLAQGDQGELKFLRIEWLLDAKRGDTVDVESWIEAGRIRQKIVRESEVLLRSCSVRVF